MKTRVALMLERVARNRQYLSAADRKALAKAMRDIRQRRGRQAAMLRHPAYYGDYPN